MEGNIGLSEPWVDFVDFFSACLAVNPFGVEVLKPVQRFIFPLRYSLSRNSWPFSTLKTLRSEYRSLSFHIPSCALVFKVFWANSD